MRVDEQLSAAVVSCVGMDVAAVPGHHPERIESVSLRDQVAQIIAELDGIRPDSTAEDLFGWARREVEGLTRAPALSAEAREALVSLLSFTWR